MQGMCCPVPVNYHTAMHEISWHFHIICTSFVSRHVLLGFSMYLFEREIRLDPTPPNGIFFFIDI